VMLGIVFGVVLNNRGNRGGSSSALTPLDDVAIQKECPAFATTHVKDITVTSKQDCINQPLSKGQAVTFSFNTCGLYSNVNTNDGFKLHGTLCQHGQECCEIPPHKLL